VEMACSLFGCGNNDTATIQPNPDPITGRLQCKFGVRTHFNVRSIGKRYGSRSSNTGPNDLTERKLLTRMEGLRFLSINSAQSAAYCLDDGRGCTGSQRPDQHHRQSKKHPGCGEGRNENSFRPWPAKANVGRSRDNFLPYANDLRLQPFPYVAKTRLHVLKP